MTTKNRHIKQTAVECFRRDRGFTIIELLVTLVIAAVIAAYAIPSFKGAIESNRQATQVNTLIASLNLARSEAVKLSTDVKVTANSVSSVSSFANGWCVHTGTTCTGTNQIRTFEALPSSLKVDSGTVTELVYDRDGALSSPSGGTSIKVYATDCPSGETNGLSKIDVSVIGRVSLSQGACP